MIYITGDTHGEWMSRLNTNAFPEQKEMTKDEALASGAECRFIERYPDNVTVYEIGDVSKELCGGPHVKHTAVLGHFKIVKEEACSAGVRRIKAILEDNWQNVIFHLKLF